MTDNEIIKALECCVTNKCDECVIYKECHNENGKGRVQVVIDLINRQKAEIERLTVNKNAYGLGMQRLAEQLETAKSEAIKKFAERLKATDTADLVGEQYINGEIYGYFYSDAFERKIDNLVKEMTEVSNG